MKTKLILAGSLLAFAGTLQLAAQNTSYSNNAIPVSGSDNVAIGVNALNNTGTGSQNIVVGRNAMSANTNGSYNTVMGYAALNMNTTGSGNVVIGNNALPFGNADRNTVVGSSAMYNSTSGYGNAVVGQFGMYSNTSGFYNAVVGYLAMYNNQAGNNSVALGREALYSMTNGSHNVAAGVHGMDATTTGFYNSSYGGDALHNNITGHYNTALGSLADVSSSNLMNTTAVGNGAIANVSDRIWLGNANVANGNIWSYGTYNTVSDGRFKTGISESDVKGLEFINLLRPVVYNFDSRKATEFMTRNMSEETRKAHLDKDFTKSTAIRQSGFIAQEVAEAAKKSGYDFNGIHTPENDNDTYGIAYSQLVVPLVKAVQEQQQMILQQQQRIEALERSNNELAAKTGVSTGIHASAITEGFKMEQNIPNPFSGKTVINYNLPASVQTAYLAVYDLSGKQISSQPVTEKGESSITINSEKLSAGIYIYSIIADGRILDSKRMVVSEK